jgi:hypothetical protein
MANDRYTLLLTYSYKGEKFSAVANGFIGMSDYDDRNPIYDKTEDDDLLRLDAHRVLAPALRPAERV